MKKEAVLNVICFPISGSFNLFLDKRGWDNWPVLFGGNVSSLFLFQVRRWNCQFGLRYGKEPHKCIDFDEIQ